MMHPERQRVIDVARSYIDVRWRHQGRSKVHGVDCGGLLELVNRDLWNSDLQYRAYSRQPDGVSLRAFLCKNMTLIRREQLLPADVLLFLDLAPGHWPCHVAIVGPPAHGRLTIIHSALDPGRVVDNGIDPSWEAKINGCFRFNALVGVPA